MRRAIVDNTVLANLTDAGLYDFLNKTRTLFEHLYIPEKILEEFLDVPQPYLAIRQRFADGILFDRGFFRRCNTFDPIVLGILKRSRMSMPVRLKLLHRQSSGILHFC